MATTPDAPGVDAAAIASASASYPLPAPGFSIGYGTAGFRTTAELLDSTVFRCGLLVGVRALLTQRACGVMVTASHNPVSDNGVKLVEPDGEMLPQAWEPLATELACASDDAQVAAIVALALSQPPPCHAASDTHGAHAAAMQRPAPAVLIGCDTRPSAARLVAAVSAGVRAMGVEVLDAGTVTTPQLHFMVAARNAAPSHLAPQASLPMYFDTLLGAMEQLVEGLAPVGPSGSEMHVDCANGVGTRMLQAAAPRLAGLKLNLKLHNTGDGQLNHGCGADFVQKERVPPASFDALPPGTRCCSVDGDADRLVFFTPQADGSLLLLDGDRMASLAAAYIRDLLDRLPPSLSAGMAVGVVQTAYANGGSTAYITETLKLPVECTPTGVKFLHEAAHKYDVGVYWEANGHGTVLFSQRLLALLRKSDEPAAKELVLLAGAINQTVGDALSGLLLVEAVLRRKGWGLEEWASQYKELPSRMTKLKVSDRSAITMADAERRCVTPEGLQGAIDAVVAQFPHGSRSFVRPSGTEDAVRVYAEAPTRAQADDLAAQVGRVVYDRAGGVGPRP
ncbi:hypothetical protein FOA52_011796 [Chlamydomonas sp. UWO 241]|nr:hypothetical protein FOA52_011796 [Chlamydomonas sp. UWO 241]